LFKSKPNGRKLGLNTPLNCKQLHRFIRIIL